MKKYFLTALFILVAGFTLFNGRETGALGIPERVSGRILLQVESNGEAWYVYPLDNKRYFLGRPHDAFAIMRSLSLGVNNSDFNSFGSKAPARLGGRILLKVEDEGRAYYVNPLDLKMHYLGSPSDAFAVMREQGLGISNNDLAFIVSGNIDDNFIKTPAEQQARENAIIHNVPFTSQAPFGEWSDQRFQDGCEEASALMAIRWAKGESLSAQTAKIEIEKASDHQKNKYGEYRDASAKDVLERIIKDYFAYEKAFFKEDISKTDIIDELYRGNTIIVPANGQRLGNPNFTAPGPVNHMLVVRGYDPKTAEFITNDPGTRKGEGYRYKEDTLFTAIRDYPTGYHEPNPGNDKVMIVVGKARD